jgi:hypothetical protein
MELDLQLLGLQVKFRLIVLLQRTGTFSSVQYDDLLIFFKITYLQFVRRILRPTTLFCHVMMLSLSNLVSESANIITKMFV